MSVLGLCQASDHGLGSAVGLSDRATLRDRRRRTRSPAGPVERLAPERKNFLVIQVGANDGEAHDPINAMIHRHRWRGVLFEPQPGAFCRLVEHDRDCTGLPFETAALAPIVGTMPLWTVPEHRGLGSLNKTILCRSGDIDAAAIRKITDATISAATLVRNYGFLRVDLLQVDTEGHDFEERVGSIRSHSMAAPRSCPRIRCRVAGLSS